MDYFKYIEDYLAGKLRGEQLSVFEEALKSDSELRSLVDNYDSIKEVSGGILEHELLNEIKGVQKEVDNRQSNQGANSALNVQEAKASENKALAKWFLVGISIFLFMVALQYAYSAMTNMNRRDKEIYAAYKKPIYEGNVRVPNKVFLDSLDKAKYLFALNKFEQSESTLKELVSSTSNQDTIDQTHFYLAHVYINQGDLDKAETQLNLMKAKTGLHELFNK